MDPLASMDDEVGQPSDSQEERLRNSTFINDSPDPSPLPSANAPVVICSLPDTPSPAAAVAAPSGPPKVDDKGKSPAVAGEAPHVGLEKPEPSKRCKIKYCASRRRLRGARIRSSVSPGGSPSDGDGDLRLGEDGAPSSRPHQEDGMRSENPQSNPNVETSTIKTPNIAAKADAGLRMLPASMRNPPPAEGNVDSSSSTPGGRSSPPSIGRAAASVVDKPVFPSSLLDAIQMFAEKPSRRLADVDLLEILEMKGIEFPPPKWWRSGGYGD